MGKDGAPSSAVVAQARLSPAVVQAHCFGTAASPGRQLTPASPPRGQVQTQTSRRSMPPRHHPQQSICPIVAS